MDALIPSPHLIAFEKHTVSGPEMTIEAKTTRTVVHCPECQQPTQKVHSSYLRHPRDLPNSTIESASNLAGSRPGRRTRVQTGRQAWLLGERRDLDQTRSQSHSS